MTEYIESVEELRRHFAEPSERAVGKQLARLDVHCRAFIRLSPLVVVASGSDGRFDASPRGGSPGFVKVVDDATLWIPDAAGNNRLDSLANIVASGRAGLLFLIPGVDETLRVNGTARVSVDPGMLAHFASDGRPPRVLLEMVVEEAFLHCAKALMRSRLWSDEARQERAVLPTMGRMLADQLGTPGPVETQAQMLSRYERDL
ncbi:MAG: MSMEG_1061 family FMN-dependent PPOX-type flavoprotein [Longimicrobiaceae bacterium]